MSFGFNPNAPVVPPVKKVSHGNTKIEPVEVQDDIVAIAIKEWCETKNTYDLIKERLDKRKRYLIELMDLQSQLGTSRFRTIDFELTSEVREKYDVVNDKDLINNVLHTVFAVCGADVANNIINWKPSLNKKLYDSLADEQKALLNDILSLSYSTPTLSIKKQRD